MDTQNVKQIRDKEMENKLESNVTESTLTEEKKAPYAKFEVPDPTVVVNDLNLYYGEMQALKNIYIDIINDGVYRQSVRSADL